MGKLVDVYFESKKVNADVANLRDLEIEVNFDSEEGQGTIQSGSLEFVAGLADKINNWNAQGMSGGAGIFEAPPVRIEACGQTIFNGGINTAECQASYECDKVIAPLRANTLDSLNDRAAGFSFAYLASINIITQSDYVKVPYVINTIPDYVNIMVAGISLYAMIKESQEIIEKTKALINELSGDSVTTVTSAANPVTLNVGIGMAIGRILVDILRITFYLLYLAFIIKTIIAFIQMIKDNLIQDVKYKKGMRVLTMFQKSSSYLGFNFSSTLLNSNAHKDDVIIPRKIATYKNPTLVQTIFGNNITHKDYDDNNDPKSTGFADGTFADLILSEEQRLNAEVRIIGNTLHFEHKEYWANQSSYTLPNIQRKNADPHGTNACELSSNYLLSYSLDSQDTNTYDQYAGTSCQMQLVPNVVLNKRNILLKNLTDVTLQYALAKIKTEFTPVEVIVGAIYDLVKEIYDAVTGFFNEIRKVINKILELISKITGGNPPQIPLIAPFPPNPIYNRIGIMLLSSDFIGVQKILVVDVNGKPHSNNLFLTAASTLMDELHFTNFAVRKLTASGATKNDHNQWLTYTDKEIPFCCSDYVKVLNSNFGKTYDQKKMKVKSLVWNPYKNTATITYRVKQQYTNNLNQKYIIDGQI